MNGQSDRSNSVRCLSRMSRERRARGREEESILKKKKCIWLYPNYLNIHDKIKIIYNKVNTKNNY